MFRPGMRVYFIPLLAGLALTASGFLPWVNVGSVPLRGFPDMVALWVMGLGLLAAVLSSLSMITRRNSRHPLLLVGLVALGLMFLSWRIMPRTIGNRLLIRSQAVAIVDHAPMSRTPAVLAGSGIYAGLVASGVITVFGLTIVVKRVTRPYALIDPDDDV
jgi:hypothetical protein